MIGWVIQFLDSKNVIGHMELSEDNIVVYQGMFGTPTYLFWDMTTWPQKTKNVKAELEFTLSMFDLDNAREKEDEAPDWMEYFIIMDFTFNVQTQMFQVFAVSLDWYVLNDAKGLAQYDIGSSITPVSGIKIIEKLVNHVTKGVVKVIYPKDLEDIHMYIQITQDPEFSALDIITKICRENGWEFCLNQHNLFIGETLFADKLYPLPYEPQAEHIKSIKNVFYQAVTSDANIAVPMMVHGNEGRIIWIKHYLGESSMMSFFIQRKVLPGIKTSVKKFTTINELDFVKTLQGRARDIGYFRLNKNIKSNPVIVGKVFGEFTTPNIQGYVAPEFGGDIKTLSQDLVKREFYGKDYGTEPQLNYVKEPTMTTPYAGNNVGMLYPQEESHRVLLTPRGERDAALVGPAYFGPKDGIPAKSDPKDFRLQLPDGCVIYNKNNTNLSIVHPKSINLTVGTMSSTTTSTPIGTDLVLDSDGIEIGTIGGVGSVSISDTEIIFEVGPNKIKLTPSGIEIVGVDVTIRGASITLDGMTKINSKAPCLILPAATIGGQTIPPKLPPT